MMCQDVWGTEVVRARSWTNAPNNRSCQETSFEETKDFLFMLRLTFNSVIDESLHKTKKRDLYPSFPNCQTPIVYRIHLAHLSDLIRKHISPNFCSSLFVTAAT